MLEALGGLLGYAASQSDIDASNAARQNALSRILGISAPDMAQQQINPNLEQAPTAFNPTLEQLVNVGPSQMQNITTDPRLAQAQMDSLSALQKRGETGLTLQDQAQLEGIRRQAARDDSGRRQAALQNLAQRGMGGSGAELANMLSSSQAAAERQSQEGGQTAAMAQQNALQAIMQAGSLGGSIQSQSFNQQAQQAAAADAIAKFNAANNISQQARNVGNQNQAGLYNLQNAQQVGQQNLALQNRAQAENAGLYQQQFGNQMRLQGAASGALENEAQRNEKNAARTAALYTGIGKAGDEAIATGASAMTGVPSMPKGGATSPSANDFNYNSKFGNLK